MTYCSSIKKECRFYEENRPLKENSPYINQYLRPDFEGIYYYSLPLNKVFAFDKEFNLIAEFDSSKKAAKECGLVNYYRISRHINKIFINVIYAGKKRDLLFAHNPLCKGSSKKVVLFNIKNNSSVLFSSFNNLVRFFKLDPQTQGGNSSLRQCLIKGTIYKEIYKIIYLVNYEGPNPVPYDEDND